MKNRLIILTDPLGNKITLPGIIFNSITAQIENGDSEDELLKVIEKPAFIIEEDSGDHREIYYFRSLSWKAGVLMAAINKDTKWTVEKFTINPQKDVLANLLTKGRLTTFFN